MKRRIHLQSVMPHYPMRRLTLHPEMYQRIPKDPEPKIRPWSYKDRLEAVLADLKEIREWHYEAGGRQIEDGRELHPSYPHNVRQLEQAIKAIEEVH